MLREVRLWLGPARIKWLAALLVITGIASLVVRAAFPDAAWTSGVQTGFLLAFLAGVLVIVGQSMPPGARRRLAVRFAPALLALLLGVIFSGLFQLFAGAALGWLLVAHFTLRDTEKHEYKVAIKAMRRKDYQEAIDAITSLVKQEPNDPAHYDFRAQLYRLNNDLRRARADYQKLIKLSPESGAGQNGLAEICLQEGDLAEARRWGEEAYRQAAGSWVALYNLGMITERQGDDSAARKYLTEALDLGLPDSRHRLLAKLWVAKTSFRLDDVEKARDLAGQLRREKSGLNEWKLILESEEAEKMRHLLADDVETAQKLIDGALLEEVFHAE